MKTAFVIGVSRGIGLATARELGISDYQVAVMAICGESFYPESTRTFRDAGISYAQYTGDIGKSEDRICIAREAVEHFGEIHALVNNVGMAPKVRADLLDMTEESFDYVTGTNTKGSMFMIQTAIRQMTKQPVYGGKRGIVINISSCSSQASSVNRGEYCVSKTGISMLTKFFADRLAPEGIFIYEIRPRVIRTNMTSQVEEKYTELIKQGMFSIARWEALEDVAKAVRAFCSDGFRYVTGSHIDVNGGSHIRRLQDAVPTCGY